MVIMDEVDNYNDEDASEEEVEELLDDLPMRVAPRLFLGSIDAARNTTALRHAGIAFTLALLSPIDHTAGYGVENVENLENVENIDEGSDLDSIQRTEVALDDALDETLFVKLPLLLATLERLLYVAYCLYKSRRVCDDQTSVWSWWWVVVCRQEAEHADKSVLVHWCAFFCVLRHTKVSERGARDGANQLPSSSILWLLQCRWPLTLASAGRSVADCANAEQVLERRPGS